MDYTQIMRDVDSFMERIDDVFTRANEDPAYTSEKALEDAISDNVRFFGEDRKQEIAEILYSILAKISYNILQQNTTDSFCNLQVDESSVPRLPQMDMLTRSLMPLGWALNASWGSPELRDTIDDYLLLYNEKQAQTVRDIFVFLFNSFPEFSTTPQAVDFIDYWNNLAEHRDTLKQEDDEIKSILLGLILEKRAELATRQAK